MTFILDDGLTDDELAYISRECKQEFADVGLTCRPPAGVGFDPVTVCTVGAFVVAVISLCLQIRKDMVESVWGGDKLRRAIDTEMMRQGIANYEAVSIHNLQALIDGTDEPCKAITQDSSGEYAIYVFREGDTFTVKVAA